MRDLDQKVEEIKQEIQQRTTHLMQHAAEMTRDERMGQMEQIQNLFKKGKEISNDKVSRAESAYELVDKQIRRLDADMFEFKKALAEKELRKVKKSRNKGEQEPVVSPKIPATAALALALTNNPGEVLDMPVDPNEPTYCVCQQVSYGEMVACDNHDCPIEWFHFDCVGLVNKPRGKWYCPQCTAEVCNFYFPQYKDYHTSVLELFRFLRLRLLACQHFSIECSAHSLTAEVHAFRRNMRRSAGVRAPFKSPLRTRNTDNAPVVPTTLKAELPGPIHTEIKRKSEVNDETDLQQEIERLTAKLMEGRNEPLDVEKELALWRNRMHAYNEAKDACLQLFGRLAHVKGCLVRDLYKEYGLDLTD
ncbi:PHD-finger, partial [Opisthorchis viverrini]